MTGRCYASPGARCTASGTREEIALRGRVVICPSGGLWTGVSSPICKNISVFTYPKSLLELFASHPKRGAYHDRHERRGGMRWTRQRLARDGIAGLVERLVSDHRRADERCCCGRQNRVVLTPRRWRQVCGMASRPNRARTSQISADDGGKRARSPGRARHKPLKPLRAGMPGDSGVLVVTRVRSTTTSAHEAAGATGIRRSPRPLWAEEKCKPRAPRAAGP